jgi:hypothetical protein
VAALRNVTARCNTQQQVDSLLQYLRNHGKDVNSVDVVGGKTATASLSWLPHNLQLNSLKLQCVSLRLGRTGIPGVLGTATTASLKQLQLKDCDLIVVDEDYTEGLAEALSQLPAGLEHFSVSGACPEFPICVLPRLQQLTYLELLKVGLRSYAYHEDEYDGDFAEAFVGQGESTDDEWRGEPLLQPLKALTRLVDLRLDSVPLDDRGNLPSVLSDMQYLSHLELSQSPYDYADFEPVILARKTQLQHLQLAFSWVSGGAAGVAQLLSYLRPLQELTHLDLQGCLTEVQQGNPPAVAYAALTQSSKLQHLDISKCCLPVGVWQYLFHTDRQLPHLTSLSISEVTQPSEDYAAAPEGSQLVSCCPGLQSLYVRWLRDTADRLPALQGLRGLHTLHLTASSVVITDDGVVSDTVQTVCQLTGLRELDMVVQCAVKEGLLQLTQLQQLTCLDFCQPVEGVDQCISLTCEVSGHFESQACL